MSPEEALQQDAQAYASHFGVELDEAVNRLKLQTDVGALNKSLQDNEKDSFAGLWIEHSPTYQVVVRFVGDGQQIIAPYLQDNPLSKIISVQTASATLSELEGARAHAADVAEQVGMKANSAINVRTNLAELYVLDAEQLKDGLKNKGLQLSPNVQTVQVEKLAEEVADIAGGLPTATCTLGFSVQNTSGTKGVSTAGHCPDSQAYGGDNLPYQGGTSGGIYDVQWHTAPNFTVQPWVWRGSYYGVIAGATFRASQSVGEWVCKHGRTSGYGCGEIVSTTFDGVNVEVAHSVAGGDSGGPWFLGGNAYGTTSLHSVVMQSMGQSIICGMF